MPTAAGAAGHVLLLLLGVLCRTSVSLPTRLSRQSQHYENGPIPSFQQPFQQSPQAQAFASKLAAPIDASQQLSPHQFVANNGPLIRAPDGQFVLAPIGQNQQPIAQFPAQTGGPPFAGQQPLFGQQPPQQQFIPQQPFQQQFGQPFPAQPQQFAQNSNSNAAAQPLPPTPIPPTGPPAAIGIADNNSSSSSSNASSSLPTTPPSAPPSSTAPPPPVDKSVDLDGDGALSLSEVQYAAFVHHGLSSSVVENLFNEVDHNKDGYLNSLEFNDIRSLVLAKAENAALRYLQNVDSDHNGMLSLQEAQNYILREYGISNRDVERIWRLVVPSSNDEMDAVLFSKLRRRVRGMSIRLARQIMKGADRDEDGHVNLREAQLIAFEQEGIGPGEVVEMLASVDDNNDGELNAPEFADFERIVRARAVETSKKALKVVDTDGSGTLTMDEAKKIAFDHYGFDEATLEPFFAQADENEDGQLDAVEFAGFRSVIRGRAVKNALSVLPEADEDGDGMVSETEAEARTRREDDMSAAETHGLFAVADQDKNGQLDKVELADFVRLVRLTSIKFVADHFRDYDSNRDKLVTLDELEKLVKDRYKLEPPMTRKFFDRVDVDRSGDLSPGEIVDFRHEIRRFAQDRVMQAELEEQNKREMAEIEAKLRKEAEARRRMEGGRTETGEEEGNNLPAEGRRETEQQVAVETSTGRKETAEEGEEDGEEVEAGEGEEQGRRAEEQREVETGRMRNSTASEDAAGKERVLGEQRPRPGGEAAPATAINSQHANGTAGTSPQPQASTQTAAIETPSTTQISTAAAIAPQASAAPPQQLPTAQSSPSPSPSQPSPTSSPASSTQPVASSSAIPIPSLSPNAQIGPNNATLANGGTQTVGEQRSIGESQQGQGVVPVGQQLQSGGPSTVGATSKRQRKRRRKAKTTTTAPTTTTTTETYDDEEEGAEEDGEEAENNEQN